MAMQEVCDVFGTARNVRRFKVVVQEEGGQEVVIDESVALSPKGLDRLVNSVNKGMQPPKPRGKRQAVVA